MSKLIYMTNMSLDGYVEDETVNFDWVNPDQLFTFITELLRPIGTYLYGRRLCETMAYWDGAAIEDYPPEQRNARVERDFDLEAVRKLKRESEHDINIGGAELAGLAFEADLVDECHLFFNPVIVGGGKPALRAGLRRNLDLLETRRFDTGVIHLHYRIRGVEES